MERLRACVLGLALVATPCLLAGCGAAEDSGNEPKASQDRAAVEASQWTDEQKAAFKQAHDRARNGEDK